MKDYHLQKCEKETIINLNEGEKETVMNVNDAEPVAYISTTQSWMKNRLRKLATSRPGEVTIREEDEYMLFATVPKKWIRISPPRTVSEEQRQKAAERFRAYHAARQEGAVDTEEPDDEMQTEYEEFGDDIMDSEKPEDDGED